MIKQSTFLTFYIQPPNHQPENLDELLLLDEGFTLMTHIVKDYAKWLMEHKLDCGQVPLSTNSVKCAVERLSK